MLSPVFALTAVGALVLLLACHGVRRAHRRLTVLLCAAMFTAAGLALLLTSFDYFHAGKAWRFGHGSLPATRFAAPFYFWTSTMLVTMAGAAFSGVGLYLFRLSMLRQRHTAAPVPPDMLAAQQASDRLLANPAHIGPDFRSADFGLGGRRAKLLSLARKRTPARPEFCKSIFAAALDWYRRCPADALADRVTPAALAEIAAALAALEARHRSAPAERADYHCRMLIAYGGPDCAWWEQVLAALVDNAARMHDAIMAAETMRLVLRHAAPLSPARAPAVRWLMQLLPGCEEPGAGLDEQSSWQETFVATTTNGAEGDEQLARLALAVFWKRAGKCRARSEHQQYVSLMLAALQFGSEYLAQQAVHALCEEFPKLAEASTEAAVAAVDALYRQSGGTRGALADACRKRVEPMRAAADPDAARRLVQRIADRRSEWWM